MQINFAIVYLTFAAISVIEHWAGQNHFTVRCLVFMWRPDVPWHWNHWIMKARV